MLKYRPVLTALALLVAGATAAAAPAPDRAAEAKKKLEALKKRMPEVLNKWAVDSGLGPPRGGLSPSLRRVRVTAPNRAKAIVYLYQFKTARELYTDPSYRLMIRLKFYAGLWTATRFEWNDPEMNRKWGPQMHFLMDAIDEAAEK